MSRRTTILGRGGTVLIAISLALLLVSLIPSTQTNQYDHRTDVPSKTTTPLSLHDLPSPFISYFDRVLTPQQGLQMSFTANGTLDVYILEVDYMTIFNWLNFHRDEPSSDFNVTSLEAFLEEYTNSIGWQQQIDSEQIDYTYIPTKVTNTTIFFANPSSDNIRVYHTLAIISLVAPSNKVLNIALWTTPIGIILAVPWLANMWKQRKHK